MLAAPKRSNETHSASYSRHAQRKSQDVAGARLGVPIMRSMDEIVLRAIQKWPNVPAVYGWLGLDRRGNWSIKGERVVNPGITSFIGRNYARDDKGRWFFQNGPQRVFVTLAYTPLVYRTQRDPAGGLSLIAHTGALSTNPRDVFLDENGVLLAHTELGVGLIHDQDLSELLMCLHGPSGEAPAGRRDRTIARGSSAAVIRDDNCPAAAGRACCSSVVHPLSGRAGSLRLRPRPSPRSGRAGVLSYLIRRRL